MRLGEKACACKVAQEVEFANVPYSSFRIHSITNELENLQSSMRSGANGKQPFRAKHCPQGQTVGRTEHVLPF